MFPFKDETSGTSVDFAYDEFGIKLAYTFEFRDRGNFCIRIHHWIFEWNCLPSVGNYGFVLPAEQIIPNGLEILDGLVAMVAESRLRGLL